MWTAPGGRMEGEYSIHGPNPKPNPWEGSTASTHARVIKDAAQTMENKQDREEGTKDQCSCLGSCSSGGTASHHKGSTESMSARSQHRRSLEPGERRVGP